ncbi:hypothetical protein TNCV_1550681 [Trichonephila clavipes]|nr:hypothetical protein TNCV_1550681 [Trichonephila clavipes]
MTAETISSPRPLSPSISTNQETPSRNQANPTSSAQYFKYGTEERFAFQCPKMSSDSINKIVVLTLCFKIRTHERTRGRKVASSSPVATEDPPYKWVRGSVSTFWCSVVGKGSLAQVSSSLLDRGSKLEVRPNSPSRRR